MWGPEAIGVRRLRSLLRGLPPDGALARDLRDDLWDSSATDSLLALLCELTDYGNRVALAAAGQKRLPQPLSIPRPGQIPEDPSQTVKVSLADFYREVSDGEGR